MSKNLSQIYATNPVTTIGATDLLYVDVTGTTDAGIIGSDLIAQFSGGSGPITAGAGVDSAQGPAATATGDGSFAFGTATATNAGSWVINDSLTVVADTDPNQFVAGFDGGYNLVGKSIAGGVSGTATAAGQSSISYGDSCTVDGTTSFAFGFMCTVDATFAITFGQANTISVDADYSFTVGNTCTVGGAYSFALGNTCSIATDADYSFAFGNNAPVVNAGSWVVNDGVLTSVTDTAVGQFNLAFTNGYRLFGGSLNVSTIGSGLCVAEGVNGKQGIVTLTTGTATVLTASVTADSRIFLTGQDSGVTGVVNVVSRTPGVEFSIQSSELTDSGVVAYQIFEPAV